MCKKYFLPVILLLLLATWTHSLARVSVLSELSQIHGVSPGDTVENSVSVRNTGESDATVRLYQTDYLFYSDGSNSYGEPGSVSRSNAAWITLPTLDLTIPPGETIDVPYRVSVPDRNDLIGSYWSMVMIEEVAPAAPDPEGQVIVRTVLRYGVQVVTEFGDSGESLLNFENPSLSHTETGNLLLQVDAENAGERMLRASFYTELYDEQGTLAARIDGERLRTYPGTSVRQRFDLGSLVPGSYTALVVADGGGDDLFGAQYTLDVE